MSNFMEGKRTSPLPDGKPISDAKKKSQEKEENPPPPPEQSPEPKEAPRSNEPEQYLQENNLLEYNQLAEKTAQATERFHAFSDKIKVIEAAANTNSDLMTATIDYAKTRAAFDGYKATKYSRKYYAEHEADIELHRAARATFQRILSGAKLPKMDMLKQERQQLTTEKRTVYKEYREAKKDMQELITAKANIDHLLGLTDTQKNKEMER